MDWRRFYFSALSHAQVYVPILSDTFLFSRYHAVTVPALYQYRAAFILSQTSVSVFLSLLSRVCMRALAHIRVCVCSACEDEMTFAWDKSKAFVPVLYDVLPFADVMKTPEVRQ